MPTAQKIAWAQLRVGLLAIVAMIILGVLVFLLTSNAKLFTEKVTVYTYMPDSASIAKGSPVRLNGILAGKIDDVTLSGESNPRRIIKIKMKIDKDLVDQIPEDSIAGISSQNVLGEKFINIKKGQSATMVKADAELPALDTRDFEEVVQQGYTLLTSLQGILKRVDAIVGVVETGKGSIGKLLVDDELYNRLLNIVAEGQKIAKALSSDRGTIGKLLYDQELYTDVRGTLQRMDTIVAELQDGKGTAGRFLKDEALYQEIRGTLGEVRKTIEGINAGKGTAGKLLNSEELHDQLKSSLAKVDSLIDKMNSGQGTVGQLLVNPALYDSLNGVTQEMQQLVKDVRANPKKFLRIKLALF